jgi:hypothetical protein
MVMVAAPVGLPVIALDAPGVEGSPIWVGSLSRSFSVDHLYPSVRFPVLWLTPGALACSRPIDPDNYNAVPHHAITMTLRISRHNGQTGGWLRVDYVYTSWDDALLLFRDAQGNGLVMRSTRR